MTLIMHLCVSQTIITKGLGMIWAKRLYMGGTREVCERSGVFYISIIKHDQPLHKADHKRPLITTNIVFHVKMCFFATQESVCAL